MLCDKNGRICWQRKTGSFHRDNLSAKSLHLIQTFFAKTQHPCASPGSIFSLHRSLWLLVFHQAEEIDERNSIWVHDRTLCRTRQSFNPSEVFRQKFQHWTERWEKRVQSQEDYTMGIRVTGLQVSNVMFWNKRLDTFWTALIHERVPVYITRKDETEWSSKSEFWVKPGFIWKGRIARAIVHLESTPWGILFLADCCNVSGL